MHMHTYPKSPRFEQVILYTDLEPTRPNHANAHPRGKRLRRRLRHRRLAITNH